MTIKWNMRGFQELRQEDGVIKALESAAERIADAAGDGFEAKPLEVTGGRVRARVAVVTMTRQAAEAEAKDHTLLRALDAGR